MNKTEAVKKMVGGFHFIPGSLFERLSKFKTDTDYFYDSEILELIASPSKVCPYCNSDYEEEGAPCCNDFTDGEYCENHPDHYPCTFGWLIDPCDRFDHEWIKENADKIAKECDLYIFTSADFDILFGIDGVGYDFMEAHWSKLYDMRGLKWHE